jgi:dipeptidyl aminopeptidase/acylaminoacyl peptidase
MTCVGSRARRFRPSLLAAVALLSILAPSPPLLRAQDAAGPAANYRLGARWAPYKMSKLVYSTAVNPRWIEGTERFWYEWETAAGKTFSLVDPVAGTKRSIFDNARLAAELSRLTRDPWDAQHLPIRRLRFLDGNTLEFEVESSQDEVVSDTEAERGNQQDTQRDSARARRPQPKKRVFHFQYDVRTQTLRELADYEAPDNHPAWASVSPDGQTIVFARNHDLYAMTADAYGRVLDARRGKEGAAADSADWQVEAEETRLTEDGEEWYSYAVFDRGDTDDEREKSKDRRKRADLWWAKNSQRFALVRLDQRQSQALWVIHAVGNKRPQLETYKYDMPAETGVTQSELLIYDLPSRAMVRVKTERFKDQRMDLFPERQWVYEGSDAPRRQLQVSDDADRVYFWRRSRDQHQVDVCVADATTGDVTVLIEERLNTYVEHQGIELLASGDVLWWSERDGWGHVYRYGPDGTLKHRLTEGPWRVEGVLGVDETRGLVYFGGNGRVPGEDPYYMHVYRVGLDGAGLTLLTPGDFDHQVGALRRINYGGFASQPGLSPGTRYFVDNHSRVNTVPAAALYDGATGRKLLDLETADFSKLLEAGYRFPEPYTVKAADGVTDLYGVLYRPFDFDSTRRYPPVLYIYPGPQNEAVEKSFSTRPFETGLAQFGFVVVTIGNRGGHPGRSKWYHNYGYGNLRDYGLADKKTAIEQLRDRHDWIDIDRVGIYGHSGGGFMSTAAMLVYPDFFKVAVSSSGNHNNDVYNWNWSEKHHGIKEMTRGDSTWFAYNVGRNSDLARNLKGRLLLTTGDLDNNVHHANTFRMAEALIRANKRFDFFTFPGQRHGYGNMSDYWYWLRAEYFVRHLLGDPRWDANIAELNLEREQTR